MPEEIPEPSRETLYELKCQLMKQRTKTFEALQNKSKELRLIDAQIALLNKELNKK